MRIGAQSKGPQAGGYAPTGRPAARGARQKITLTDTRAGPQQQLDRAGRGLAAGDNPMLKASTTGAASRPLVSRPAHQRELG